MRFLIIQTAFTGDVILALPVAQKLRKKFPDAKIDFLVRKGNEIITRHSPFADRTITCEKRKGKWRNFIKVVSEIRTQRYDIVFNLHRFFSSGIFTASARSEKKIGFNKNPLSFLYTKSLPHHLSSDTENLHEIDRNLSLLDGISDITRERPVLNIPHETEVKNHSLYNNIKYIMIAPASVWKTKQYPAEGWISFINSCSEDRKIYLIGSQTDYIMCESIRTKTRHPYVFNLCDRNFSLIDSACLMQYADRVFTNDSAALHLASAVNAKVTAVFCSTIPAFGFFPLSEDSRIVQIKNNLPCRPCGIHGKRTCPLGHFRCANDIDIKDFGVLSDITN